MKTVTMQVAVQERKASVLLVLFLMRHFLTLLAEKILCSQMVASAFSVGGDPQNMKQLTLVPISLVGRVSGFFKVVKLASKSLLA